MSDGLIEKMVEAYHECVWTLPEKKMRAALAILAKPENVSDEMGVAFLMREGSFHRDEVKAAIEKYPLLLGSTKDAIAASIQSLLKTD